MKKLLSIVLLSVMLLSCISVFGFTSNAKTPFSIVKTDIKANSVINSDGFASLQNARKVINKYGYEEFQESAALVNSKGEFVFEYKDTNHRYYVSDGIISFTSPYFSYRYWINDEPEKPEYYNLDGSKAFSSSKYNFATPIMNGYGVVSTYDFYSADGGTAYIINKNGKVICTLDSDYSKLDVFASDEEMDYCEFDKSLSRCSDGLFVSFSIINMKSDDDYDFHFDGYMNTSGKMVIDNTKYANGYGFYEGLACVVDNDTYKCGYIDKTGNEVIECQYDSAGDFYEGYAYIFENDKCGYIDKDNQVIIPCEYDDSYGCGEGFFTFVKDGMCGMVNAGNSVVIPFEYDDITAFKKGVAYAIKDGYLYIIINENTYIPFYDIPASKWYTKASMYCYEKGFMTGTKDNFFSPDMPLTRGQITLILAKVANADLKEYENKNSFSDVAKGKWYHNGCEWAYANGIASGSGGGLFKPNDQLTREQLAVMLYAFAKKYEVDVNELADISVYDDYSEIANWAKTQMAWAVKAGLLTGTTQKTLSPKAAATRGQAAVIVSNFCQTVIAN